MLDTTSDAEIKRGKRFPKSVDAIAAVYLSPADQIAVSFVNGIEIRFPRLLLEGLESATDVELSDIEIDAGRLLVWTKIVDGANEDAVVAHDIPDLMDRFAPSGRVMTEIGRLGGSKTSPAKAAAVRANGKKGGRPRTRGLPSPI
jgi:hypothetical protein